MKKIGIMGGTFDPIHIGHLILANTAYEQFGLDEVLFIPAGNPPHKRNRSGRATDEQRIEMVRLAIASNPAFSLSLIEMEAGEINYSYRTLEKLKAADPESELYFIVGGDSLYDFDTWREPVRISELCHIVAGVRKEMVTDDFEALLADRNHRYPGDFHLLNTPNLDISSHHLREMVFAGQSVQYYVPDPVYEYICSNDLYKELLKDIM